MNAEAVTEEMAIISDQEVAVTAPWPASVRATDPPQRKQFPSLGVELCTQRRLSTMDSSDTVLFPLRKYSRFCAC